jgi:hypothetical protein
VTRVDDFFNKGQAFFKSKRDFLLLTFKGKLDLMFKMKNKNKKVRNEVVEEVYMRLENVMDWYKEGGDGEFSNDWSVEEVEKIMKMFLGK